jgi:hypothetical protein
LYFGGGQIKIKKEAKQFFGMKLLHPDSVDRLLDARNVANFKKFDKTGEHKVTIKGDENLIVGV